MYLNYYRLKSEPFHITPDPEFLYLSPSHKEALGSIMYGIKQKKGFIAITGAIGVGKTTILRSYLEGVDKEHLKIIYVFNARLTFDGLLKIIYEELGLHSETNDTTEILNNLYRVLIDEYKQGNNVILVVDEAQNMPLDTLESLRMLSNLETSKDKLIQIVLVGQPEFEDGLNLDRLRQLKQRIAVRAKILPLSKEESLYYIQHRMQKAGANSTTVFTKSGLQTIVNKAGGIPRVINILCDNALITGYGYQRRPIDAKIVREVIADIEGKKGRSRLKWQLIYGLSAVCLALGVFLIFYYDELPYLSLNSGLLRPQQKTVRNSSVLNTLPQRHKESQSEANEGEGVKERLSAAGQTPLYPKETSTVPTSPQLKGELQGRGDSKSGDEQQATREKTSVRQKKMSRFVSTKVAPVLKTVEKGDTLTKLTEDVYGKADGKLIRVIQDSNPQIVDPNLIQRGSTIVFPELPEGR